MKKQNQILNVDYRIEDRDIVFTVEGAPRFKMKTEILLRLFSPDFLTRPRPEQEQVDALRGMDSLATLVRQQRLLKKGFSADEAAKIMEITPELFRISLARGVQAFGKDAQLARDETARQAREEGDYCLVKTRRQSEQERARGIAPDPEFDLVPTAKVRDLLRAGQGIAEIGERLGFDNAAFAEWARLNETLLS